MMPLALLHADGRAEVLEIKAGSRRTAGGRDASGDSCKSKEQPPSAFFRYTPAIYSLTNSTACISIY